MLNTKRYLLPWVAGIFLLLFSCQREEPPLSGTFKGLEVPKHFPEPVYRFGENTPTEAGFSLGRKLFYEPLLSKDGSISCGSCHHQEAGFSDPGKAFSEGVNGKLGLRNSPAMANLAWFPSFMADGGINHIEVMPIAPLTDSLEMAESLSSILKKLQGHKTYPQLFEAAFGTDSITDQNLLYALAQFMALMVSANSKYDDLLNGKTTFSLPEERGLTLFREKCASCHQEPLLTDFSFRNNGLDLYSEDPGRARITLQESDRGKFKVPSLRNIAFTAPYMHDGRFNTLSEVLDHYGEGIKSTPNLAPELAALTLSETEKQDLLHFLSTLTDYKYITDTNFSNPQKN